MKADVGREAALEEIITALRDTGSAVTSSLASGSVPESGEFEPGDPRQCALCLLAERSVLRWMRTFFAEFVNDPQVRVRFRKARGFCRSHTPLLARCGDALGVAILYADLADETRQRWRNGSSTQKGSPLSRWFASDKSECPACAAEADAEARYMGALAQGLAQERVWEALQVGRSLCVLHVERMATIAPPAHAARLLEMERQRMDALYTELEEFIRKNDYRFREEPWGPERDAWRRALSRIRRP